MTLYPLQRLRPSPQSSAVYVEPKWAALLSGSGVEELLGKKPEGITVKDAVGVKPSGLFL